MKYLQKLLKINAKKLDFILILILSLLYKFDNNNLKTKTMKATEIKSSVYEIKINRKWSKVRATNMKALSDWAKENNVSDWRMVGMMSNAEIKESQLLKVVA